MSDHDDPDLSALIRRHATRHKAPDRLRAAVQTQLALAEAGRAPNARPRWFARPWRAASAGFAAGLACALLVLPLLQRMEWNEPLEAALVANHVRALQVGPLVEVASSDRHSVKPWFQGRVDFAPPVLDLAADGFPLVGGRVERLRGETVAALAYRRNQHVIDVYVWPSGERMTPQAGARRGFSVLQWADGSMRYAAVSDLDAHELAKLAPLWQERSAAR